MGSEAPWIAVFGFLLLWMPHALARNEDRQPAIKRLRSDLFSNYDRLSRPVLNPKNTIKVNIGVSPIYLTSLDEVNQVMTMQGWVAMNWKDEFLTWNPNEYEGLKALRLPAQEVWLPDISVYNSIPAANLFPWTFTQVILYSDGLVMWVPPASISTLCPVSSDNRDTQVCNITLGSWTYDSNIVNILVDKISMENFRNINSKWEVVDSNITRRVKYYPCCEEPYATIIATFKLRRRSELSLAHWVAPLLTLAMFWVPPDNCHKLTVGGLALLTQLGFMAYNTFAPTSVGSIYLSVFPIKTVMAVITAAILLEILVLALTSHSTSTKRPPASVMRLLSGGCTRVFCVRTEEHKPGIQEKEGMEEAACRREWLLLATAMDRVLFLLFAVLLIITRCLP